MESGDNAHSNENENEEESDDEQKYYRSNETYLNERTYLVGANDG